MLTSPSNGMYVYGSSQQIGADAIVAEGMCWIKTARLPPTDQNGVWNYNATAIINDDNGAYISTPVFRSQSQGANEVTDPSWDDVVEALQSRVLNSHGNLNIDNQIRLFECQILGIPYDGPPLTPKDAQRPRLQDMSPKKAYAVAANQAPRLIGTSSGPNPVAPPSFQNAATNEFQRHQAQGSTTQVSNSTNNVPLHPSQGSTVNISRENAPLNLSQGPAVNTANSGNRQSGSSQGTSIGTKAIAPPGILRNASTNQLLLGHQTQGSTAQASNSGDIASTHLSQGPMLNIARENATNLSQDPRIGTDHNIDLLKLGAPRSYNSPYASPQRVTYSKVPAPAPQATQVAVGMGIETNHQRALQHQSHMLYQQAVPHYAAAQHRQSVNTGGANMSSSMPRVYRDDATTGLDSSFPRYQVPHLEGVATMVPPQYPANPLNIGQHAGGTKRKIDDTNIHASNSHLQETPEQPAKRVALSPAQTAEANARQSIPASPRTSFGYGNPQMVQGNVRYVNGVPAPGAPQPSPTRRARPGLMNGFAPQPRPPSRAYAHPPQMNGSPRGVPAHQAQINGSPMRGAPAHPAHPAQMNRFVRPSPPQMISMGQTYNAAMCMNPHPRSRSLPGPPAYPNIPTLPFIPTPTLDINTFLTSMERDAHNSPAADAASIQIALDGLRRHTERRNSTQGRS